MDMAESYTDGLMEDTDLNQHAVGARPERWHGRLPANYYAWLIVVIALSILWALALGLR